MKFQKGVLSLATLALLAACSGHKHQDNQAGSGGESPVSVKFTQTQGAALADINGRLDFGGQVAVSSYSVGLDCLTTDSSNNVTPHAYTLSGGRMLVRSSDEACVSTLKKIVVTDQHGLTAIFEDVAPTQDTDSFGNDLQKHLQADAKYPNLHLDISGHSSNRGTQISYTYTLRDSAQGNNTVGTNAGDIGTATQVTVLGVPLPDVSPNKATAWAVIDGSGAGAFWASVPAESAAPCGADTYGVELYGHINSTHATAGLLASGVPSTLTSTSAYQLTQTDAALAANIFPACRGLTTNLYLKLSCTNASIGTSYKLIAIQSQIPNSPYTDIGDNAGVLQCVNAATDQNGITTLQNVDLSSLMLTPSLI